MLSKVIAWIISAVCVFPLLWIFVYLFWQDKPSFRGLVFIWLAGVLMSFLFDWIFNVSDKALRKVGEWLSRK